MELGTVGGPFEATVLIIGQKPWKIGKEAIIKIKFGGYMVDTTYKHIREFDKHLLKRLIFGPPIKAPYKGFRGPE